MATTKLILSILVCFVAVFLTLDIFEPYREKIIDRIPENVKNTARTYFDKVRTFFITERIMTKEELADKKGADGGPIYLAILGKVYDVTMGKRHYGPGESYDCFAGRDGTRAFVTGDFTEKGLIEDIRFLALPEILALDGWQKFYENDYKYVGKLVGSFYDSVGKPTSLMGDFQRALAEAEEERRKEKLEMTFFPPCNSEWAQGKGRRVWCSNLSGGVKRDWVGVPRQYYEPGKANPRCACVKDFGASSRDPKAANHKNRGDLDNPNLKPYDGCEPNSPSCSLPGV